MPIALGLIAALLIISGIKGNIQQVGSQFETTFFGTNGGPGFIQWLGALLGLAVIFRLIGAETAGKWFIILLLVVYSIKNGSGLIPDLQSAIASAQQTATSASTSTSTASTGTTQTLTGGTISNNQVVAPAINSLGSALGLPSWLTTPIF